MMKIISFLFLLHISFSLNCKPKTLSDDQPNTKIIVDETTTNSINKPTGKVSIKVIDISSEKAILEFSNQTNKTIYLFYNPNKISGENTDVFRYWFRCKEKGKKEIDYNQFTSHILPSLDPLGKDASFRFEVSPLPNINADCKVSLLYYDDEKIAYLVNNKPVDLDKSEQESVEKAKKSAEVKFRLTNAQ